MSLSNTRKLRNRSEIGHTQCLRFLVYSTLGMVYVLFYYVWSRKRVFLCILPSSIGRFPMKNIAYSVRHYTSVSANHLHSMFSMCPKTYIVGELARYFPENCSLRTLRRCFFSNHYTYSSMLFVLIV